MKILILKTSKHIKAQWLRPLIDSSPLMRKVGNFFIDSSHKDLSVIHVQAQFMYFLVEHNLPLACTDHVGPLVRKMFPDSANATK